MTTDEKIKVARKAVECCFVRGCCFGCPFYQGPMYGRPGRCMGMKNAGKLIMSYLDDIGKEVNNGKEKRENGHAAA